MLNRFKQKFKSLLLTTHFWKCVMAYNEVLFNKEIEGLRKVNSEVADRLLFDDKPKCTWSIHTFDPLSKSLQANLPIKMEILLIH